MSKALSRINKKIFAWKYLNLLFMDYLFTITLAISVTSKAQLMRRLMLAFCFCVNGIQVPLLITA